MKKLLLALVILCSTAAFAEPSGGPLLYKNQFPLFTHLNTPYFEKAALETSFSATLSHSSVYLVKESAEWSIGLDMEVTELSLRYRKKVSGSLELGAELPFLSLNSGFLDAPLDAYHSAFGFPDYGRSNRPDNEFLYSVKKNGTAVISGKGGGVGTGDLRLTIKRAISEDPAVSLMATIELPSGDAREGYGNGSLDAGALVLLDKRLGERFTLYGNAGIFFPGDLKGENTIELKEYMFLGAAIEAALYKELSFIGQLYFETSPYPSTGIAELDRNAVLLSLGGRYSAGAGLYEFTFTEDPGVSGAPDFSFSLSFKRVF